MMNKKNKISQNLLQSKAIKLNPANPFTWASGWKSPIYCDNRITLSYPDIRTEIRDQFTQLIQTEFKNVELIAGVATGAIAHGVLVAEILNLPFAYVRSTPKGHGMQNLIEGEVKENQRTVVIEDLVSTGNSSLKAVDALRQAKCNVLGMCAIFSYNFATAQSNFNEKKCPLFTLTDYNTLINLAADTGYIKKSDIDILAKWSQAPDKWDNQ
jgi:orotate phosphoribosyltransferase